MEYSRAQNRHDRERWKKKKHPASNCGRAKCGVCHPHKRLGGNHKGRVKTKYLPEPANKLAFC